MTTAKSFPHQLRNRIAAWSRLVGKWLQDTPAQRTSSTSTRQSESIDQGRGFYRPRNNRLTGLWVNQASSDGISGGISHQDSSEEAKQVETSPQSTLAQSIRRRSPVQVRRHQNSGSISTARGLHDNSGSQVRLPSCVDSSRSHQVPGVPVEGQILRVPLPTVRPFRSPVGFYQNRSGGTDALENLGEQNQWLHRRFPFDDSATASTFSDCHAVRGTVDSTRLDDQLRQVSSDTSADTGIHRVLPGLCEPADNQDDLHQAQESPFVGSFRTQCPSQERMCFPSHVGQDAGLVYRDSQSDSSSKADAKERIRGLGIEDILDHSDQVITTDSQRSDLVDAIPHNVERPTRQSEQGYPTSDGDRRLGDGLGCSNWRTPRIGLLGTRVGTLSHQREGDDSGFLRNPVLSGTAAEQGGVSSNRQPHSSCLPQQHGRTSQPFTGDRQGHIQSELDNQLYPGGVVHSGEIQRQGGPFVQAIGQSRLDDQPHRFHHSRQKVGSPPRGSICDHAEQSASGVQFQVPRSGNLWSGRDDEMLEAVQQLDKRPIQDVTSHHQQIAKRKRISDSDSSNLAQSTVVPASSGNHSRRGHAAQPTGHFSSGGIRECGTSSQPFLEAGSRTFGTTWWNSTDGIGRLVHFLIMP
eukprot:Lithocolla_globosa_v1_NODE_442_length_4041_cov_30.407677.p1 type:complete len:636 gc:universal NODE_442_length_4041_cov_30.407677:3049-1142(-)